MSTAELDRVLRLAPAERLELIARIWDSLVEEGVSPDLSKAQIAELDERLNELERNPEEGLPWPEVRRRITQREDLE